MNVVQAMNAVMKDVKVVEKNGTVSIPGQASFKYRGVDAVVEALSASIRSHGIVIVPVSVEPEHWVGQTSKGNNVNYSRVTVGYTIHGPEGDSIPGQSVGEAMDSGDKSLSKAMSVSWRTFLLEAFHLPTNDPDPDSENYEAVPRSASGVPANWQAQEAALTEWQERINATNGDHQALIDLYNEARQAKASPAIISLIVDAGNKAKAGRA